MAAPAGTSISFIETTRHSLKAQGQTASSFVGKLTQTFHRNVHRIPEAFFHYPPITKLPPSVQEKSFRDKKRDIDVFYYVSRAPVERGVLAFCSGFKEAIPLSNDRIEALNKQGISIISLRLPNVGKFGNFMEIYEEYERFWFLDPESPVHQMFGHLPDKFAAGHSTGGGGVIKIATHPDTAEDMKQFRAIFADAPYVDSPSSSEQDPWWRKHLFTAYALACGDKLPEETVFGTFYLVLGDINTGKMKVPQEAANRLTFAIQKTIEKLKILQEGGDPWGEEIPEEAKGLKCEHRLPTYEQILEIRQAGREHLAFLRKNGVPDHAPIYIYADPIDHFSSYRSDLVWKDLIGATLIESTGLHNTLNKDENSFKHFSETMERDLPPWPLPKITVTYVNFGNGVVELLRTPEPPPVQEKGRWYKLPPLKTAIGLSQAPVRLWSSATDIFHRAFGRSAVQPDAPLVIEHKAPIWEVSEKGLSLRGSFDYPAHTSGDAVAAASFAGYTTQPGALALDKLGDGARLAL